MAPADLWYRLSGDILHSIAAATNYLHALTLLRSVCASWRSSIDKPSFSSSSLPLSFPFPIISVVDLNYYPPPHCYFKLTHNTLYFLTPPAGRGSSWLLRVQEPPIQNHDGSITYHPLSPLSKSEPLEKVPESINLLDVAIAEVGRAHCLKVVNYDDEERKARKKKLERAEAQGKYLPRSIADIADYFLTFVKKVALSPPDHGVIAVVIVLAGRLCSFNLGAGNGQWTYLDPHNEHYHDVVHRKGKFFVVDYRGSTVVIDGADLQKEEVKLTRLVENPFPEDRERFQFTRLVESGDELLLIDRHALLNGLVMLGMITEECHPPMEENYFQVYRLDEVEKRWEPVNDLGHKVLLLGDDYVFSVDAWDFTGLRGNCIYFSDIGFIKRNQKKAGIGKSCVRMGVYDLRDRRCGPLAEFPDHWPVFAPPPAWLKPKRRGRIMKGTCHLMRHNSLLGQHNKTEGMKEKYLQRDVTTSQQDVPEPSAKAKKKAAEAKVRGDDAYRSKDYLGALDAYTQAIDFDPSDATLLSNRSICWIRLGQAKHALTDAKSCRALRPDWAKACYREGAALQLLQRFDEAANSFKEGLDLDPDSKDLANAFRFPPMWIIATFSPRLENFRSSLGISMPELRAPPIPPLPRLLQGSC